MKELREETRQVGVRLVVSGIREFNRNGEINTVNYGDVLVIISNSYSTRQNCGMNNTQASTPDIGFFVAKHNLEKGHALICFTNG